MGQRSPINLIVLILFFDWQKRVLFNKLPFTKTMNENHWAGIIRTKDYWTTTTTATIIRAS